MHVLAKSVLSSLLERGERASTRENARGVSLLFTDRSMPEYFRLPSRLEKDEVHAVMNEAQRAGAIIINWERSLENGQLERVRLVDTSKLAAFLGVTPHPTRMAEACDILAPWGENPKVIDALKRWGQLKAVRGRDVGAAADLADSLRVLDYMRTQSDGEVAVRTASAALFKSSKRIEALVPLLDYLTTTDGLPRPAEEVLGGMGLVKHPSAVLLTGRAQVRLLGGELAIPAPFLGLAPHAIEGIELDRYVHTVLTVENLTTFHELAAQRASPRFSHLVIYTAGMPSPSFMRCYRRIVRSIGAARLMHWGDIDPGGFRIAAVLAQAAREEGRALSLWQMRSAQLDRALAYRTFTSNEVKQMRGVCTRFGWPGEGHALGSHSVGFEQEALCAVLPPPPDV